jgi:UDP-GlcNAc:undecaprenyl-phosphate/decaprenyl-phosphate GlcNAc-1-phosphate transferase
VGAYLVVFAAAAMITFVATPLVRRAVIKMGVIDYPSDRRVHPKPTPTMGGLAMYLGFVVAFALSMFLPTFRGLHAANPEPLAAFVTCSLMMGLGAVDDIKGVRALTKLTAQIFVGGVLVVFGVQVAYFFLPGQPVQILSVSSDLAVPLTILWVVVIANAVNLVDGLDGLASGMVAIASTAFFVYMVRSPGLFGEASEAALLSAITAGICIGFLPWNFHPARIFMGDSGSMLLGMLIAIATISGVLKNAYPPGAGDIAAIAGPVAVPLLVLFVPFLDVLLAVVRRTRRHQGIGVADKEHIHHRLMDIGHGHRQAVLLMYLWSALISGSALAIGLIDGRLAVGAILVGSVALFLVTALPRLAERRRNGDGNGNGSGDDASGTDEAGHGLVSDTAG